MHKSVLHHRKKMEHACLSASARLRSSVHSTKRFFIMANSMALLKRIYLDISQL